jgi:hypothetical protein
MYERLVLFLVILLLQSMQRVVESSFVFVSGDDSDDSGHCETADSCNGLIVTVLNECIEKSTVENPVFDMLVIGLQTTTGGGLFITQAASAFFEYQEHLGFTYEIANNYNEFNQKSLSDYKMIYVPSDEFSTGGGVRCNFLEGIRDNKTSFRNYVNQDGGSIFSLTEHACGEEIAYAWFPKPLNYTVVDIEVVEAQAYLQNLVPALANDTTSGLAHCCYHTKFIGPPYFSGMNILVTDPEDGKN